MSIRRIGLPAGLRSVHLTLLLLLAASVPCVHAHEDGEAPAAEASGSPRNLTGGSDLGQRFVVNGFADVNLFLDESQPDELTGESESAFGIGELDLYMRANLSKSISFFSELVFEIEDDGQSAVDVERLYLKYSLSDRIWISVGRRHNHLGYWNETFHHGLLLQPTVERPLALRFEDDGGFLPIHGIGVSLGGKTFSGPWELDYVGSVTNGRGIEPSDVQSGSDVDDHKALGFKLSAKRDGKRRIQFGPMAWLDRIPPGPAPGRANEIEERILGAHFNYRDERIEVIAEYFRVRHDIQIVGARYDHPAYYAVAVWRPWNWKPYLGVDARDIDQADPFFAPIGPDVTRYLAGVRWDVNAFHALKFEYRHDDRDDGKVYGLAVQAAFSF